MPGNIRYLLLDGVTMKVKGPSGVKKKLVLKAYGIRTNGKRVLLDFGLTNQKAARSGRRF